MTSKIHMKISNYLLLVVMALFNALGGCREKEASSHNILVSETSVKVPSYKPEDCDLLLFKAYEKADWKAVGNLYEPGAVFVLRSYNTVKGREDIQKMHASNAGLRFTNLGITTIYNRDSTIATTQCRYAYTYSDSTGKVISDTSLSLEVLRKQNDNTWRFVIDDPDGGLRIQIPSAPVVHHLPQKSTLKDAIQ
jgi:ketosteroid isomerase-like protein